MKAARLLGALCLLASPLAHAGQPILHVTGEGSRTVVLQSGLGDDASVWDALLPLLAPHYRVVRIDRPGYGAGAPSTAPRDPCTIADETRDRLVQAGIAPPWLLVGHSLGGLYQYVFARRHPDDTDGLVLLDPTHPAHWATMQQEAPGLATALRAMRTLAFSDTARAEFDAQAACLDSLDERAPLPRPTRVLVSDRPGPLENDSFRSMLRRLRQDWLQRLDAPGLQVVWDSGHYLQREVPQDVADAIDAVARDAASP